MGEPFQWLYPSERLLPPIPDIDILSMQHSAGLLVRGVWRGNEKPQVYRFAIEFNARIQPTLSCELYKPMTDFPGPENAPLLDLALVLAGWLLTHGLAASS